MVSRVAELGTRMRTRETGRRLVLVGLALLALACALAELSIGAVSVPPAQLVSVLAAALTGSDIAVDDQVAHTIVVALRLPRLSLACLVGASLALAGATFQSLFRNPLADPQLIGVSSGAAVGAVTYIVLPAALGPLALLPAMHGLPLAAMAGAILSATLLFMLAQSGHRIDTATVLLAGIAINALCMAIVGLMVFLSDEQQLTELSFWTLGSLARANWATLLPTLPVILLPTAVLLAQGRRMNALVLGEVEAEHLGIHVNQLKRILLVSSACAVGVAVALSGVIGFIGLVVPHLVRLLVGADNRLVLPGSAALGAALLLGADLFARTVAVPAEVPIGVVTSLLGAPFFFWLIIKSRNRTT